MKPQNYPFPITNKCSIHIGNNELCYLIPTIGFQKLNWNLITKDNYITYLFAIKWLTLSFGIIIKINKSKI